MSDCSSAPLFIEVMAPALETGINAITLVLITKCLVRLLKPG